jgi:hypothetical protein
MATPPDLDLEERQRIGREMQAQLPGGGRAASDDDADRVTILDVALAVPTDHVVTDAVVVAGGALGVWSRLRRRKRLG